MMIAPRTQRVPNHTSEEANQRIRRQTEANIAYYAVHPDQIPRRIRELDQEWDIEATLETWFSVVGLTGMTLSVTSSRRWLMLPFVAMGFFLQHALQGWCPPLPLFRRLGVRTSEEIEQERRALEQIGSGEGRQMVSWQYSGSLTSAGAGI